MAWEMAIGVEVVAIYIPKHCWPRSAKAHLILLQQHIGTGG
jgi:hypothetical protein